MKVLVAGLGSVGQRHVRNLRYLNPSAEVIAYRSRRSPLPDDLQGPWISETDDLEQALARGPTAALVCNPTRWHLEVALPAARAGCHLLIEKPVSHSMDGIAPLHDEVRGRRLVALVGFQWRFHPALRAVKRLLDDGSVGRVVHVNAHWGEYLPAWHPGEDYRESYAARADLGGGVLLTLCHPFDYLRWMCGEIAAVTAVTRQLSHLTLDVEDTADVLLEFESGAAGMVHLDFVQMPAVHRIELVGEDGAIRWDHANGAVQLQRRDKEHLYPAPDRFERNDMFAAEMQHFLDCLEGDVTPVISLDDGIAALAIALAAKRASAEGRRVLVRDVRPS